MTLTNDTITPTPLSITQLNQLAKNVLQTSIGAVWVQGEISNFMAASSGHWYFSLKDAQAQVRCAMFAGKNRSLGFVPKNGTQVFVRGQVSLYEGRGEFQLIADSMEDQGAGKLRQAFEALKQKLSAEGFFNPERKRSLPVFPKQVGVVTSPTGAAIRDVISVLKRRSPNLPIIIYPTAVQGVEAPPQIVRAIQLANARKECDVLIVGRGGGSVEDLWSFNEEIVSRAIAASEIPIISAVGHEIDFTIADFVADIRAPTPSAAAEMVVLDTESLLSDLNNKALRLHKRIAHILSDAEMKLDHLKKRLKHPRESLERYAQMVDEWDQRIKRAMQRCLETTQMRFAHISKTLHHLSPLSTLDRGYAIVQSSKQGVIAHVDDTALQEFIQICLSDGTLGCIVESIQKNDH